jgi:hypothetical protein
MRAHKGQSSLSSKARSTSQRRGWRGSPVLWTRRRGGGTSCVEWPGAGEAERHGPRLPQRHLPCVAAPASWHSGDGGEEGAVEQRRKAGGLGLMQGKQSSTTPSPAGPAPIPRWRLDHGRLRLGRRRPWLGLLRLRSGHARADDDEDARLRLPPRMALPQRLQLLPSSSLSDFGATLDGLGKIPHGRRGLGRGRQSGFIGRHPRVSGLESGQRGCGVGARGDHPRLPTLQGAAALGPARCSCRHGKKAEEGERIQGRG